MSPLHSSLPSLFRHSIAHIYPLIFMNHFKIVCNLLIFLLLTGCVSLQTAENGLTSEDEAQATSYAEPVDPLCGYVYFVWGRMAELSRQLPEAQEAYTKALICDEHSAYLHQRLAFLLINMGKVELASIHLERVLENSPKDNQTRRELAGIFDEIGKTEMAIDLYNANLADDPKDSETYFRLGYLYQRRGHLQEARAYLETHVELQPRSYAGNILLAKLYRSLGEDELAFAQYERVLTINWSTMQAYEAAEFYEGLGEYDRAIDLYLRLLKEDTENEMTRRRLAGLYSRTGQGDKALAQLFLLRTIAKDVVEVDLLIGRLMISEKQYDKAINHLLSLLKEHPELPSLRPLLGLAYHENGDDASAKKVLRPVAETSPVYEGAVLMYVRICVASGNRDEGIAYMLDAIEKTPAKFVQFYYVLADMYRLNKQLLEGEKAFEQAIVNFPDDIKLKFELGLYFEKIKRPDRAMAQMLKVLEIAPDDAYTLNYIGYTWADRGENMEQALDYIKRAVEQQPEDGYVRDSLGWVHYKMGEYDQAVVELYRASELVPEDPTIKEHLGDAYLKVGELEKAIVQYEEAVSLFKDAKKRAFARQKIAEVQDDDE